MQLRETFFPHRTWYLFTRLLMYYCWWQRKSSKRWLKSYYSYSFTPTCRKTLDECMDGSAWTAPNVATNLALFRTRKIVHPCIETVAYFKKNSPRSCDLFSSILIGMVIWCHLDLILFSGVSFNVETQLLLFIKDLKTPIDGFMPLTHHRVTNK